MAVHWKVTADMRSKNAPADYRDYSEWLESDKYRELIHEKMRQALAKVRKR